MCREAMPRPGGPCKVLTSDGRRDTASLGGWELRRGQLAGSPVNARLKAASRARAEAS